jgi:hypothetical protein
VYDAYPTGVAVSWAQHHGGPWPSTNSQHTSVGASAIRRFLRPVTWQGAPQEVLPQELTDDYRCIPRRINGKLQLRGNPVRRSRHRYSGQVPRVVPDGDRIPHIRGESEGEVPQPMTVDPVALHHPRGGHGQQQQVQGLERGRHAGQPVPRRPAGEQGLPGLRVHPVVVGIHDVPADRGVQLG